MDIGEIIKVVQKRSEEIAEQEILKFNKEYPEINLTEEAREAVRIRSTSQLTLQLSKFHFHENEDLEEQFNKWFSANEEDDLRRTCRHCLDDEAKKIRNVNEKNLSSLDSYLKKHLGDIHEV